MMFLGNQEAHFQTFPAALGPQLFHIVYMEVKPKWIRS